MIHPYLYAGLGQPTSKLFHDIQASIAKYGGRSKLIDAIEGESIKHNKPRQIHEYYEKWKIYEDRLIIDNFGQKKTHELCQILGRSYASVNHRIKKFREQGTLGYFKEHRIMNLKNHWHIIWDTRKFGGKRTAISVNQLEKYIPENRAKIIRNSLLKTKADRKLFSIQNKGIITAYSK